MSLFNELKRRNVIRVAAAYLVIGWLIVQVIEVLLPMFDVSASFQRGVVLLLLVGFLPTLFLSWAFELTPEGIKQEKDVVRDESITNVAAKRLNIVTVIAALAVAVMFAYQQMNPSTNNPVTVQTTESSAVQALQGNTVQVNEKFIAERLRTIAVLPFDNYSPNEEDAYFAAGITEEITGQLARIGDLTVLSRVAVERAVASENSLEDVARLLGAGTVLEGSVRMAGQQVRITAQLIEVETQRHLWSENFDRELTDIFQIQTDVALAIGDALLAQLSGGERLSIETPVTDNIRAYQLYLRQGRLSGNDPVDNREAIELLEQALELDPGFAEARARLSWFHTWTFRMTGDPSEAELAEVIALEALKQDPELPLGHYALAAALEALERLTEAGDAYARAYRLDPNYISTLTDGSFYFATRGVPAEGLEMAFSAVRLDPNSPNMRWHAYIPLFFLGDTERSTAWLQLARGEEMEFHRLAAAEAELELAKGNLDRAAAMAREMLERFPNSREATWRVLEMLFLTGDASEVSDQLLALGQEAPGAWAMPHFAPRSWRTLMGFVLAERGEDAAANRAFDESLEAAEEAVANGSTMKGRALDAASIYAYRGDHEAALRELERAYALGFRADFALAVDPFFVSVREEHRFKALLKRMADSQREQGEIALRTGLLEGYDKLILAGPTKR